MTRKRSPSPLVNQPTATGWSKSVGSKGTNLVTVYERLDKKRMVYIRWTSKDGLQRESTGRMLPWIAGADAVATEQLQCVQIALDKSRAIIAIRDAADAPEPPAHPSHISLRAGLLQVHEAVYRGDARNQQHAKEQRKRIDELCEVFADNTAWNVIAPDVITPFVEARATRYIAAVRANNGIPRRGAGGLRQTEKALAYLFQASRYLASQSRTLSPFVPPRGWLDIVRRDWYRYVGNDILHTSARTLRYTVEERDLLIAALGNADVDPRIRVAVAMGSGSYRLGQVIRMKRSHIEPRLQGTPYGRMTIVSAGKKQGGGYLFTEKELAAWDMALTGYLRAYEAAFPEHNAAYPLFPSGVIQADGEIQVVENFKPIDIKTLNELWHRYEEVAGVERMPGRGWYGLRRASADILEATAIRIGYQRGLPLEEMAVLLATNHAHHDDKGMQWHYRAESNRTVDLDNLYLREELERPQAAHVRQKLDNHRNGIRSEHPPESHQPTPQSTPEPHKK